MAASRGEPPGNANQLRTGRASADGEGGVAGWGLTGPGASAARAARYRLATAAAGAAQEVDHAPAGQQQTWSAIWHGSVRVYGSSDGATTRSGVQDIPSGGCRRAG